MRGKKYTKYIDVFEEGGFNSNPFCNDFGMQTIRGIAKPVLRALQLLNELGSNTSYNTTRMDGDNYESTIQVYTLKNNNGNGRYTVFIGNWNLYGQPIMNETISLQIKNEMDNGVPKTATMYRIDADNVNPISKWKAMGSPTYPTQQQMQQLNASSQYVTKSVTFQNVNSNTAKLDVSIPEYGVVVLDLQY